MEWQTIDSAPKDGTQILCTWVHHLKDGTRLDADVYHVLAWWPDWHGEGRGAWVLDGDFELRFRPDGVHETPPIEYGEPTHWCAIEPPQ